MEKGSKTHDGEASSQRRGAERVKIRAQARLREAGCTPFEVELTDLSSTGCRMVTFARLQIGTTIWLNLPSLAPLEAIIRRNIERDYGCEFLHPLHPAVAEHLQKRLRKDEKSRSDAG